MGLIIGTPSNTPAPSAEGAVLYDQPQSLTEQEKQQARENISAGTSDFKGTPVANTIPAAGMLPNVFYKLGELSSDLTVTLQSPVDQTISNEYRLRFSLGATAHTITFPNTVKWPKGVTPSFAANTTYEVNIEDGYGYIGEF